MTITNSEYWEEVNASAHYVVERAIEALRNDGLEVTEDNITEHLSDSCNEYIDRHQYVIYNAYHLPILQYSDNLEYAVATFGDDCIANSLRTSGLDGLHQMLALYAFYADVQDLLSDQVAEQLEALEDSNE